MMKLLEFNKNDLNRYIELASEFHSGPGSFTPPNIEVFKSNFFKVMDCDGVKAYFIEVDNSVVGYMLTSQMYSTEIGSDMVWIEEVSISKDYQGQGLGSLAIQSLIEKFPDIKRFRLEVAPTNLGAKKLYKKLGFVMGPYEQMYKDK